MHEQHRPREGTTLAGPRAITDVVETAAGRVDRRDPNLPGHGGPAGNARLTAWTGLVLLVLLAAEGLTILQIHQLVRWHIVIGVLLIPPALLKTGSTGWRIARYYAGARPYRAAGPPPAMLRLLGPLVVLSTLAVLASGLALVPLGLESSRTPITTVAGQGISPLTIHQLCFVVWFVLTTVHVLARTWPAWRIVTGATEATSVDGAPARMALLFGTLVLGAAGAAVVLAASTGWTAFSGRF